MRQGKGVSKPSEAIAWFHEMKFAVVARLFEGRSPEFRSHRRMSPWNSNRWRVCDAFAWQHNLWTQTSILLYDAWHEKFKCYNLRMNKIVKVMRRTMFCTLLHRKCRDCWERQRKRKTEPPSNCPVKSFLSSRRRVNCVKGSLSGLRFFYAQSIRVEPRLTSSL